MKHYVSLVLFLTVVLLFFCALLMAEISPFALVGEGNYAGKLATYASGDTIVFVSKAPTPNTICYKYSYDGGLTWQVSEIQFPDYDEDFLPTLSYKPDEALVTFKSGLDTMVAQYLNGETFTGVTPLNANTFDTSPFVEKLNGQLKSFSLDIPYPNKITVNGVSQPFPGISALSPNEYVIPSLFTDLELNEDNEPEYYTGTDVLQGIVRTNHDLYIKQSQGGTNNGWPVFNGPVLVGGQVISIPPHYPVDQVFRGGLICNVPHVEPDAFRPVDYQRIGPAYDPNTIIFVQVNGSAYSGYIGRIQQSQVAFTDVWPDYPEGTEEAPLFWNYFTVVDTVWSVLGAGSCRGHTNFVDNKLWLKGNFGGEQTWWSSSDIEIVGDISLQGVPIWQNPSGNYTDKLTLVSEKNIVIKYGYRGPLDSLRYHTNMGSDDWYPSPTGGGVFAYASLYALGNGEGNPREDGVFTFEYQHPHPSVEATVISPPEGNPTVFDWIDLHRYHYPQTAEHPWPANIDYPWYNPLWPEQDPYLERGTINIWGSLMQRRRGYVHRDYYDHDNPDNTIWNPALGLYGGSSSPEEGFIDPVLGVNMQTRNYPGAMGNGVGYKKNYNFNANSTLSDYWHVEDSGNLWGMGLNLSNWSDSNGMERYYRKQYLLAPKDKCFARKGERAYYSIDDQLLYADLDAVTDISYTTSRDGVIRSIALGPDATPFVCQLAEADSMYMMTVKNINPGSGMVNYETTIEVPTMANDVCVMPNGRRLMAAFDNQSTISLWEITSQGIITQVESWQINSGLMPSEARLETCRLYMLPSANDRVEVFFYIPADAATPGNNGALYHAYAGFPVSNEDYTVPAVPMVKFSAYPNPMRSELKLQVENAKASTLSIDVYNIRGQLVHRIPLPNQNNSNKIEYTWDGKDANKQKVASGIYVLRLMADNKAVSTKRICRY